MKHAKRVSATGFPVSSWPLSISRKLISTLNQKEWPLLPLMLLRLPLLTKLNIVSTDKGEMVTESSITKQDKEG